MSIVLAEQQQERWTTAEATTHAADVIKRGQIIVVLDNSYNDVLYVKIGNGSTAFSGLIPFYPFKDDAVTTARIIDGAVTTAKINADAIDGTKIGDNVINSEHYAANSIDEEHISNDAVGADQLIDLSITGAKIGNLEVGTNQIANGTMENSKYSDNSISLVKMQNNSVDTAELVDLSVSNGKIANNTILPGKFSPPGTGKIFASDGSGDAIWATDDEVRTILNISEFIPLTNELTGTFELSDSSHSNKMVRINATSAVTINIAGENISIGFNCILVRTTGAQTITVQIAGGSSSVFIGDLSSNGVLDVGLGKSASIISLDTQILAKGDLT